MLICGIFTRVNTHTHNYLHHFINRWLIIRAFFKPRNLNLIRDCMFSFLVVNSHIRNYYYKNQGYLQTIRRIVMV